MGITVESGAEGCGIAIVFAVLIALTVAFNAWVIMVLWGALASVFGFATIGFGTAVLVSLALTVVGSFFKNFGSK